MHKSTVSRELRRNTGQRGYRARQAHSMATIRQKNRARTTRITAATWALVEQHLRQQWSPEQISGWLRREHKPHVSHERIYQYVYNENTNGLARRYFPKGSDFTLIIDEDVEKVMQRLNHRPRKTLGFTTPHQVFFRQSPVALIS